MERDTRNWQVVSASQSGAELLIPIDMQGWSTTRTVEWNDLTPSQLAVALLHEEWDRERARLMKSKLAGMVIPPGWQRLFETYGV